MDGQIEDRLCSVQDVSEYLGAPGHTIYAWRSTGLARPAAASGSGSVLGQGRARLGAVAPDVSRGMKPLGLGEHGQISITREGAAYMAYAGTAITPG